MSQRRHRRERARARSGREMVFADAPRVGEVASDPLDEHHRSILRSAVRVMGAAEIDGIAHTSVLMVSLVGETVTAQVRSILPTLETPPGFITAVAQLISSAKARGAGPDDVVLAMVQDEHGRTSGFLLERGSGGAVVNASGGTA